MRVQPLGTLSCYTTALLLCHAQSFSLFPSNGSEFWPNLSVLAAPVQRPDEDSVRSQKEFSGLHTMGLTTEGLLVLSTTTRGPTS